MRPLSDGLMRVFVVLCLVFLLLPIIIVVAFSFSSRALATFPFGSVTVHWYRVALGDSVSRSALWTSLKLAGLSGLFGAAIGGGAAYGLVRANRRIAALASSLIGVPLVLPYLVIGVALSTAFSALHLRLSTWTALSGHIVIVLPVAFAIVAARIARFDWAVEDASRDLGARPMYTFVHAVLPAIRPAFIAAFLIGASFSLDEFVVTFFTIGVGNTLPLVIWTHLRTSVDPSINAIGTLLIGGTVILTSVAVKVGGVRL